MINRHLFAAGFVIIAVTLNYVTVKFFKINNRSVSSVTPFEYQPKEFMNSKIYEFSGALAVPPVRYFALLYAESKVEDFLDELPLDKEIKKRIMKKVESEYFSSQMVPFLLAVKDWYTADEQRKNYNFKNHVFKYYPDEKKVSGLSHSLFEYEKLKRAPSSILNNKEFLAKIIEVYDAMLVKDPDYRLGSAPVIKPATIERVKPKLKEALLSAIETFKIQGENADVLRSVATYEYSLEALTVSLTEAIMDYAYQNYRMLAQTYDREKQLEAWLQQKLKDTAKKDTALWDYLNESLTQRRYGVQVVVDGLQGELVRSLSSGQSTKFLQQISHDQNNYQAFKPEGFKVFEMMKPQRDFLNYYIDKSGYSDEHYLPFFKNLFKQYSNSISSNGVSTTPTISVRNLPIAKTGAEVAGPGGTGLPNFHFLDRKKNRAYYFFGNDALKLPSLTQEQGMKTLFERLPYANTLNCMSSYPKGASWSFDPLVNLIVGEMVRDFGDVLCYQNLKVRALNEKKLISLRKEILSFKMAINSYNWAMWIDKKPTLDPMKIVKYKLQKLAELEFKGMPQLMVYYSPWTDHFAHGKGPFSDEIVSPSGELNRLDFWLSSMSSAYDEAGISDRTLWAMAGDHGLTPVYYALNPEVVVFKELEATGYKFVIEKISSDEGEGPKLNHDLKPKSMKGVDFILASTAGGNYMIDAFADQGANWARQPYEKDLLELNLMSGQKIKLLEEIKTRLGDTLDYMVIRTDACDVSKANVKLISPRGDGYIIRRKDKIFYQSSHDVLQVTELNPYQDRAHDETYQKLSQKCIELARAEDENSWCNSIEWRKLASYSPKPDSVNQIAHLYDTDLAGTINLFPVKGIGYNTRVPGRHAGEDFHEKDAFVGVWGKPIKGSTPIGSQINGSSPTTIYEWVSGTKTQKGVDGWGFDSLINFLKLE
jgi:hypothetical protein